MRTRGAGTWRPALAAAFVAAGLAAGSAPVATALAQSSLAADKTVVDAAKARGQVGEQSDGYLGIVSGSDPAVASAVAAINAGRASAYRAAAARTGTSPEAAGAAAAQQLITRMPSGQFYRTAEGAWVRK